MANEIDRLEIQVQAEAKRASAELDKLIGRLEKVSASLTTVNGSGLQGMANGIDRLSKSMQQMSTVKTTDFSRLARNIEKLGNIDQSKINSTASAISTIARSLTTSTGLTAGAENITNLATSISRLGYKSASTAITNIPLMANALKDLMRTLSNSPQVSKNLIEMTNSLGNLASQGSKVRSATNSINRSLRSYSVRTKEASVQTRAFAFSIAGLVAKIYAFTRALKGIWKSVEVSMDYIETINLFQTAFKKIGVDTAEKLGMDLGSSASEAFAKAFIDRAQSFSDRISDALSLDPDLMMNYQAVFAQMSNSMNLTAASAMNISESFTMLGNDIASLWNIDTDIAMKKLQSGLAGQIRPLRELGVDISKTSLEMYAMKYGIEDSVETMSQAAKVQLRWLAIMEQAEVAFGDMAKTIDNPANQLRILQQQWRNLSRSIGSVFIPVISAALPYINAVVIALRRMIDTFATAVGFELPDFSNENIYRDLTTDIEGMGEEAEGAQEFIDKLKKSLLSFDDLNILSSGSKGSKGGIFDNLTDGYDALDDAINQKTISYMEKFNEELADMQNRAEEIADAIQPKLEKFIETIGKIGPAIKAVAGVAVASKIMGWVGTLSGGFSTLGSTLLKFGPKGAVVLALVGGFILIYDSVKKYNKKLKEEDLAKRFGDISLSLEEVKDIAERLTADEYNARINIFISEQQKLAEIESDITKDIEKLNKFAWKVSVGLELTEGESEEYKSTIKSFVANMDAYIEQQHYVTSLAVDVVIQDETFKGEMSQLVDQYFYGTKGEMARLGEQLQDEFLDALASDFKDEKKNAIFKNTMKEMAEIQERISNAEFVAKLQTISIEGDLDADSYKKLFKEIQDLVDDRGKKATSASEQLLTVIRAQYQIDMEDATTDAQRKNIEANYNRQVKEIQDNLSESKIIISQMGMEFAYDKINEKWKPEIDAFGNEMHDSVVGTMQRVIDMGIFDYDPDHAMWLFFNETLTSFQEASKNSGLTKAGRKNLEEFLEILEPTSEDNKAIADEYIRTGQLIPETLQKQLTDEAMLKALAGDVDGILYIMGQQMAESPEIVEMIKNGEIVGGDLDDSIIRGMKSKLPELKKEGANLVIQTDKAIVSQSKKVTKSAESSGQRIINAMRKAFDNDKSVVRATNSWLGDIKRTVDNWKAPQIMPFTVGVPNVTGSLPNYSHPNQYATGGFPNTGEMFIAREAGPELVGKMGSRSVVANNAQIATGIEDASYRGMMRAIIETKGIGSSSPQMVEVPLYLDSEELARGIYRGQQSYDGRTNPVRVGG